ncbi:MAG: chondroitinase family protein, partial [Bacteroidaceae bacterium]
MKSSLVRKGAFVFVAVLLSSGLSAQLVKHERLVSFEESAVPTFISSKQSSLSISPEHYKDGKNSMAWTFQPGGELFVK